MLVLSRKTGEQIMIADDIIVTVVQMKRGRVRLGIVAPPEVAVRREELAALPEPLPTVCLRGAGRREED
jgi:carbon storage regulator